MTSAGASPYLMSDPPTSPGRAFLARAFAHWCALDHGFSDAEIAAALDGSPTVDANLAQRVANAARLIGEVLAAGHLRAWARPMGGGVPESMDPSLWELDDWKGRMATSAVALAAPFDPHAPPSHYVFVELEPFNALIEQAFGAAPKAVAKVAGAGRHPDADAARDRGAALPPAQPAASDPDGLDRLLRLDEVKRLTGLSRSTLYDRIKTGRFPATVEMVGNIAAWRESDVREWLRNPR